MYSMLSTPTTWDSIGCATLCSTTSAPAPGYEPLTSTTGGTMSGNWATGMALSAISPASVMTIEMTIASRGRSMKVAEIISRHLRASPVPPSR